MTPEIPEGTNPIIWNNMHVKKVLSRVLMVALNGSNALIKAFSGLLISWLVLRFSTLDLWGEFTAYWVSLTLMSAIASFGNKDFLIREFSKKPNTINLLWNSYFWSRAIILLGLIPIFMILFPTQSLFFLAAIWFILNFIQLSFDCLNVFSKNFWFALFCEIGGLLISIAFIFYHSQSLSINILFVSYCLNQIFKTIINLVFYRVYIQFPRISMFSLGNLRKLMPFFLLGLGGFMIDKSDLLFVSFYLVESEKAAYQILSNLCTMGLVALSLILAPFSKNIYRMGPLSFNSLKRNYAFWGILFSIGFMSLVYLICKYFYRLHFPPIMYFLFFLSCVFFTLFLPNMYLITKNNRQQKAAQFILLSGALTLAASVILVSLLGMTGAALACAFGQFSMWISSLVLIRSRSQAYHHQ